MADTRTKPKTKPAPKTAPRGRPRGRPREPSEGRIDDVDARLRARARGPEGRKNEEASSGAFGDIDDRLTRLESKEPTKQPSSSSSRALSLSRPTSVPSTTAPMLVELIVVTVDEILGHHRPPIPSRVGVVVVLFGGLGLVGGSAAPAAAALAWGLVIASVYSTAKPGGTSAPLRALATVGDFISGKYATKPKGK